MGFSEIIEIMKSIYNEDEKEINYIKNLKLTQEGWDYLNKLSFIVITNETFKLNELKFCVDKLKEVDTKIIYMKYLNGISEYDLIEHYKYHTPKPISKINSKQSIAPYQSSVPSIGWPIVRERFSKPLIVCMLEGKLNNFNDSILKLKGNTNPKNCINNEIRSKAPNIAFTLMHSADDIYSVLRESMIFLGENKVINIINNRKNIEQHTIQRNEKLLYLFDLMCKPLVPNLKNVINKLKQKIVWCLLIDNTEISLVKNGLEELENSIISNDCNKLDIYVEKQFMKGNDLIYIYKLLSCEKYTEHTLDVHKVMNTINSVGLIDDEWNYILLESYFSLLKSN